MRKFLTILPLTFKTVALPRGETVAVKIHCVISTANIWECRYQMWQDGGEGARVVSSEHFF